MELKSVLRLKGEFQIRKQGGGRWAASRAALGFSKYLLISLICSASLQATLT